MFETRGWQLFDTDAQVAAWAHHAAPIAARRAADPDLQAKWLRADGTWFVGADVLGNDADGCLETGPAFAGAPIDFCRALMPGREFDWGPGQVSTMYPNYPLRDVGESDGQYRFRRYRDAAHLDGLKPINGRRFMQEFHGFILGLPLNDVPKTASPFVIWEGSHIIMAQMLSEQLAHLDPNTWAEVDLTEVYQETRRTVFQMCQRVEVHASVGQSYLAHRFAIHGVAPWSASNVSHRTIAYFRPFWDGNLSSWLQV